MYNVRLPVIYYIKHNKEIDYYYLEPRLDKYKIPEKLYGDTRKIAIRVWNTYVQDKKSTGILLTGQAGTGKSLLGEVIANIALDNSIPVVVVSEIEVTINLISFISTLTDTVVLFDEFSKNVKYDLQEASLTMFSDMNNTRKLFILTENEMNTVSGYIRNRPGRIRYHIDYNRIDKKVLLEYCEDSKVGEEFIAQLLDKYDRSTVFTFDHLQAIVSEHKRYPADTIDELINILNLGFLEKPKVYKLSSINNIKSKEVVEYYPIEIDASRFDTGMNYWVNLKNGGSSIKLSNKNITNILEDEITLETDEYLIKLRKEKI